MFSKSYVRRILTNLSDLGYFLSENLLNYALLILKMPIICYKFHLKPQFQELDMIIMKYFIEPAFNHVK